MTTEPNSIISRALQIGGPGSVPAVMDGDVFKLPTFSRDFVSDSWPAASGPITLRYPSFADEVEIERMAVRSGGTILARALAAFMVCLESAPPNWWRPNTDPAGFPLPAPDRLPCVKDLVGLWSDWLVWRDSFRGGVSVPAGGGAEPARVDPVAGGPGA